MSASLIVDLARREAARRERARLSACASFIVAMSAVLWAAIVLGTVEVAGLVFG